MITTIEQGLDFGRQHGYPVLVKPTVVLGGIIRTIAHNEDQLRDILTNKAEPSEERPVELKKLAENLSTP